MVSTRSSVTGSVIVTRSLGLTGPGWATAMNAVPGAVAASVRTGTVTVARGLRDPHLVALGGDAEAAEVARVHDERGAGCELDERRRPTPRYVRRRRGCGQPRGGDCTRRSAAPAPLVRRRSHVYSSCGGPANWTVDRLGVALVVGASTAARSPRRDLGGRDRLPGDAGGVTLRGVRARSRRGTPRSAAPRRRAPGLSSVASTPA